jgi:hypothetical protein
MIVFYEAIFRTELFIDWVLFLQLNFSWKTQGTEMSLLLYHYQLFIKNGTLKKPQNFTYWIPLLKALCPQPWHRIKKSLAAPRICFNTCTFFSTWTAENMNY